MSADFPTADRNRLVREAAECLFSLSKPVGWHPQSTGGESDFGLDYLIQVSAGGAVTGAFYVQLKGTERLALVNSGTEVSFQLKRSTLNYYAKLPQDVMLVVCDITLSQEGGLDLQGSRIYWQWISSILRSRRGSEFELDLTDTQTSTVRVPVAQVLTRSVDVRPHLEARLGQLRAGASLSDILAASDAGFGSVEPAARLEQLVESARLNQEAFVAFALGRTDAPSAGMPAAALEIRALIRSGKTEAAASTLERLGEHGFGATDEQRAWWLGLSGKVATQRGDRTAAIELFEAAHALVPIEEHLLPLAEMRFLRAVDTPDTEAIESVRDDLLGVTTDEGHALLVRVHVALRELDEAELRVTRISTDAQAMPAMVLLSGKRRWAEVIGQAEIALERTGLSAIERSGIELVAARAAWFMALESARPTPNGDTPLSGAIGTDQLGARRAWELAKRCALTLRDIGWPPNVQLLAPIYCAAAGTIGVQKDALPLLVDAAQHRPGYADLQNSLELLALGASDTETALAANLRQPDSSDVLARRAAIQFQLRRYSECLSIALQLLDMSAAPHGEPLALAMGYAAAKKLARSSDAAKLLSALGQLPATTDFLAFAEYARETVVDPGENNALHRLREGLVKSPNSQLLAANLLANLDTSKPAQAQEALNLVRVLRFHALLPRTDTLQEIYALSTLERWSDASEAARRATARFGDDQAVLALLAVAEEMNGHTGAALDALERAMACGTDRLAILHNYMGIAIRLGRLDCVGTTIDRLLAIEGSRRGRLELLRLRSLVHVQQGETAEAARLAHEYGEAANRDDEDEEGIFLNLVMTTVVTGQPLDPAVVTQIQERTDAFCERWPESRHFRRVETPLADGRMDLDSLLAPVLGDVKRRMQEFKSQEQRLKDGRMLMPFIMRPGVALHYVSDAFDLWLFCRRSRHGDRHLQFDCDISDPELDLPKRSGTRDIPLLDLTSLLVLDSLGLFAKLFNVFERIAIPKMTVAYVSQCVNSPLARGPGLESARSILKHINEWLPRIDQPGSDRTIHKVVNAAQVVVDYIGLAGSNRWIVYCDDAAIRVVIRMKGATASGMTTTAFLGMMDGDPLTPVEIAGHLGSLVEWNVGIDIPNRYLIASLSGAVPQGFSGSARDRLELISWHRPFTQLARALSNPDFSPTRLVQHMGQLLVDMLGKSSSDFQSIAAVTAFWFTRIRMFKDTGVLDQQLLDYTFTHALALLPIEAAPRAIGTLRATIEVLHGDSVETESLVSQMPSSLGKLAGTMALQDKRVGELLLRKLLVAMPGGTIEGDAAIDGYASSFKDGTAGNSEPR